jgi:hypothetical protein
MEVADLEKLLDAKLDTIHAKLDAVVAQTTKTNGRVNCLEEHVDLIEGWKNKIVGGLIITNIIAVPVLIYSAARIVYEVFQ